MTTTMISTAIEALQHYVDSATKNLEQARTQIKDQFEKDYVVGSHAMEKLISAQHSVHYWAQIARIIERGEDEASVVQGLREWATRTADRLLECGRSSSTSLVSNAIILSEEDEQKRVLRDVSQFIMYVDKQG